MLDTVEKKALSTCAAACADRMDVTASRPCDKEDGGLALL
jgi:hypothetical protein